MNIVAIEPYYTGSHKNWLDGLVHYSSHDIDPLTLDGKFWKWRMHGGAVSLAEAYLQRCLQPDLILATDMLDLTTFMALTRSATTNIPIAVYFHENQITYPWSPDDRDVEKNRNHHYGFINYVSALAANGVFFNSQYHRDSFISALQAFLKHFPDHRNLENIDIIAERSRVLPLALSLSGKEKTKPEWDKSPGGAPVILWNHRWEFDKNPEDFFQALYAIKAKNIPFRLIVIGENFSQSPAVFEKARTILKNEILQFGYVANREDYRKWLYKADIIPVTSRQDFFGASIVEAIYFDCIPLLPARLAYPEIIQLDQNHNYFYHGFDEFVTKLETLISGAYKTMPSLSVQVQKYDWSVLITEYDKQFASLADNQTSDLC